MPVKPSTKHPYAAIEHRVIDSPAYIALTYSAQSLLTLLVRQLNGKNNGRLQATEAYLTPRGFSDRTITRGIAELIAAGLIYRTRCGGFHQGPSLFAVTWLPIGTQREGLFLNGFKPCAWRDWQPGENKGTPANLRLASRKSGGLTGPTADKFTAVPSAKFTDIELLPHREGSSAPSADGNRGFDAPAAIPASTLQARQSISRPAKKYSLDSLEGGAR
jgi:hypothetical protein